MTGDSSAAPAPSAAAVPAAAVQTTGALGPKSFPPDSLAAHLYAEPFAYSFFQAVRLLERIHPQRKTVGRFSPVRDDVVRFKAHLSLAFPPSEIYDLQLPPDPELPPVMVVSFMGLTGPSGVLPRHYTERILQQAREGTGPEKNALQDWFELFNHRLISLFYRAWEKYRFYIPFERREWLGREPDAFTQSLYSLIGLGMPSVRNRLRVSVWETDGTEVRPRDLGRIPDLALLHYAGFLAHRPRCAAVLSAMLGDYFELPAEVLQFQGQWFKLEPSSQAQPGNPEGSNLLGVNAVAGDRVWDIQCKIRCRLGPLRYTEFTELLPDAAPVPERKTFFLLAQLIRLYVGPELDFDVQLVLRASDVPKCSLGGDPNYSPRLGWNTWIANEAFRRDADEPVFEGHTGRWLNTPATALEIA